MPRILIVAHESFRLFPPNPLDLAELLSKDGHEVTVAAPFHPDALRWNTGRGFAMRKLAATTGRNGLFWWESLRAARDLRPDVVIGVNVSGYVAADLARGPYAKHAVLYALELLLPEEHPRSISTRWQAARANKADLVISTGLERAREMQQRFGLRATPDVILNSPIRPARPPTGELRRRARAAGCHAKELIVYSGGLGTHARLLETVEASRLWKHDAGVVLMPFGGSSEERAQLERAVAASNGRAVLLPSLGGSRDDLLQFIADADVGLVFYDHRHATSMNVTHMTPNKLYDYLAAGLPVIASDLPVLQELVEGLGFGRCCHPQKPEEIARTVDAVLDRKHELRARSAELFRTRFHFGAASETARRHIAELVR
jgi:glycosyltransferase involved in cell wall biosynthesis